MKNNSNSLQYTKITVTLDKFCVNLNYFEMIYNAFWYVLRKFEAEFDALKV